MIYEEHVEPGAIVVPLSLDLARPLYQKLGLTRTEEESSLVSAVLKSTVRDTGFSNWNARLWEVLRSTAAQKLPSHIGAYVVKWVHDAYTGYHPANPNMLWASILLSYSRGNNGWPDVGQTPQEQAHFNEFAEFFLRIWGRESFNAYLERLELSAVLSEWDKVVFMKYGMVPFDEDGNDPLMNLKPVWKGEALRQAIRKFRFDQRPDFPMEKLRRAGQIYADSTWMPPGVQLGSLLEVV